MTDAERAQIMVTARLLEAAGKLDILSTGMTLIAAASLVFSRQHVWPAIVVIVLGLVAKLYAVRITFDAKLLRDVSSGTITTADLDAALVALALAPREKAGREWTARCRGAKRLVFVCVAATIGQCIAIVAML